MLFFQRTKKTLFRNVKIQKELFGIDKLNIRSLKYQQSHMLIILQEYKQYIEKQMKNFIP